MRELIESTPAGLYCSEGDFWIDPWLAVPRAVVTHAHTDHARWGCGRYLTTPTGRIVLAARLGSAASGLIDALPFGQGVRVGDVRISLHPAGHVLGSAQVRVQRLAGPHAGETWVVSGDYKLALDGVSEPFEPVRCDTFITESTFGLPVYIWPDAGAVMAQINTWWLRCTREGRLPILACYALGKAQRLLAGLDATIGPILIHGALRACTEAYVSAGVAMPKVESATHERVREARGRAIVLAPPSAVRSAWAFKLPGQEHELASAMASGWMTVRGGRRRQSLDTGFALSDHADWPGLLAAIAATGAQRVGVTHGSIGPMVRYLRERGLEAFPVETRFVGEQAGVSEHPAPGEQAERAERDGTPGTTDATLHTLASPGAIDASWTREHAGEAEVHVSADGFHDRIEAARALPSAPVPNAGSIALSTIAPSPRGSSPTGLAESTHADRGGFARFAGLFLELDATTKASEKLDLLTAYFSHAQAAGAECAQARDDAAWAVALFTGRRVKRAVTRGQLRGWAVEAAGIPDWLVDECHGVLGDFGETLALLLPAKIEVPGGHELAQPAGPEPGLADVCERLAGMVRQSEHARRGEVLRMWAGLDRAGRLVFHKIISATFRLGVSRMMVVRALAAVARVPVPAMEQRLMGVWPVTGVFFASLFAPAGASAEGEAPSLNPLPFFLAHQLPDEFDRPDMLEEALGPVERWQAEWKWDGIRAQLIREGGRAVLWSRGEEPLTEQFPEIIDAAQALPDGLILDGEVLAFERGEPLDFAHLQTRITKRVRDGLLFHDVPTVFMAYDVLRAGGLDVRDRPLRERRALLEGVADAHAGLIVRVSPVLAAASWPALAELREHSRERGVEGLMLKRLDSRYGSGRTKLALVDDRAAGAWWKWKVEPYTVDCVLVAAQRGSGRRASLFTDYTFAVWTGPERGEGQLVTFAKAYHGKGMTDAMFLEIDAFVRGHTTGRIPSAGIRSVEPRLVFELAFEGVQISPRHKSGVAVRFPRINRWRRDKQPSEADTLGTVKAMLASHAVRLREGPRQ